jgi:hypothetical protein
MVQRKLESFSDWGDRVRRAARTAARNEAAAKGSTKPRKRALRPAETSQGVIYLECYRYFHRLKKSGRLKELADFISTQGGGRWQRHKGEGVENVVRLLEKQGKAWVITPSRRARIVTELNFAAKHEIHRKLLLAFLYEAGPHSRIVEAAAAAKPAPWILAYQRMSKAILADTKGTKARAEKAGNSPPPAAGAHS